MLESVLLVCLGFLAASLIALMLAPVQWRRAVRLTEMRIRSKTPLSMADIQADKDRLRAEFAISTRRLEMKLAELSEKSATQLAEIVRRGEQATSLAAEAQTRGQVAAELEAELNEARENLIRTEELASGQQRALKEAGNKLVQRNKEFEEQLAPMRDAALLADERKVEIAALKTQMTNRDDRIADLEAALAGKSAASLPPGAMASTGADRIEPRLPMPAARPAAGGENMAGELSLARAELSAQSLEIEALRQQAAERREEIETLKTRLATMETLAASGGDPAIRAERDAAEEEKAKLIAEVEALRAELAKTREKDRLDNTVLRDRIADIAAKVAGMTAALEIGERKIDKILEAGDADPAPNPAPDAATAPTLAQRIRALKTNAAPRT